MSKNLSAIKRYQDLSEEQKEKKRQHGRERYKNHLSEDEEQKLVEYRKKNYRIRKNSLL